MKVLHAAAEVFPLVKTGGLADVLGALPQACSNLSWAALAEELTKVPTRIVAVFDVVLAGRVKST